MQERRYDGTEVYTNRASEEEIARALDNPDNKSVGVYPPDAKITIAGTRYIVDNHGSLVREK